MSLQVRPSSRETTLKFLLPLVIAADLRLCRRDSSSDDEILDCALAERLCFCVFVAPFVSLLLFLSDAAIDVPLHVELLLGLCLHVLIGLKL